MKAFFYFLLVFSILSCRQEVVKENPAGDNGIETVRPLKSNETIPNIFYVGNDTIKSYLAGIDSFTVADQAFQIVKFYSGVTILLDDRKNIVHKDVDYSYEHSLLDFNGDGYKDLKFKYLTNVPDVDKMLLFDTTTASFREIGNFSDFPSSWAIEGTSCYYSYSRAGCADSDWISKLFVIDNFHCTEIGKIYGRGCGGNARTGIFIYRVENKAEIPFDSIIQPPGYYEDKWTFIERYWSRYHTEFIN